MTVVNEILMTVVNVRILRESSPGETSSPTPLTLMQHKKKVAQVFSILLLASLDYLSFVTSYFVTTFSGH